MSRRKDMGWRRIWAREGDASELLSLEIDSGKMLYRVRPDRAIDQVLKTTTFNMATADQRHAGLMAIRNKTSDASIQIRQDNRVLRRENRNLKPGIRGPMRDI